MPDDIKEKENKEQKKIKEFPESSNKDFWGDAEVNLIPKKEPATTKEHIYKQFGPELVCVSCPHQHTLTRIK